MLRIKKYILAAVIVAGCGTSTGGGDSSVRLTGAILLPPQASNGTLVINSVNVAGQIGSAVCTGAVTIDSYTCDANEDAFLTAYFLAAYTVSVGGQLITFKVLTPAGNDNNEAISSLGNLYTQRALELMAEGVSADSAMNEAIFEVTTALGGLNPEDADVQLAFEKAVVSQAHARGFANSLLLTDLLQQDFTMDEMFDGKDVTMALAAGGKTLLAQDWLGLEAYMKANLSNNAFTLAAMSPAPSGLSYILIEPLVVSNSRDVVVTWSNAFADSYDLAIGPNQDCSGAGAELFSGLTDTTQLAPNLTEGGTYYLCLTAHVGAQILQPLNGVTSFRVSSNP